MGKGSKQSPSQKLAERKSQLSNLIEDFGSKLKNEASESTETEDLTLLSLSELQHRINEGTIGPKELLTAFQTKCISISQTNRTPVSGFIEKACDMAEELSGMQHSRPRTARAPLFGIPVSVDEIHLISGQDCTLGLGKLCGEVSSEDCVLIKVLKEEGVIPYVQTANPQGFLYPSSANPIVGELDNPISSEHVAGAGSSGEAVLLSKGGSPVGFGSDLSGGLRLSAAFCGLAGLKPSSKRIGNRGTQRFDPNPFILMPNVPGPMGKCVDDLAEALRSVLRPALFRLDTYVPPLSFHEQLYAGTDKPHLNIGFYISLDDPAILETVPSVRNAINRAVKFLEDRGHHMHAFQPPNVFHAFELSMRALYSNATKWSKKNLAGEPVSPEVKQTHKLLALSQLRHITSHSFGRTALRSREAPRTKKPADVYRLIEEIQAYRETFINAMFENNDLDVIIAPVWASPAPSKNIPPKFTVLPMVYSIVYNMLDMPAGVVPVGVVTKDDLETTQEEQKHKEKENEHCVAELFKLQENSINLPLSVQVVGKPYHEEVVLRIMKELENAVST